MPTIQFGGLASGLDTTTLIDKLVAVERSSAQSLVSRQTDLTTHKSIVNSMSSAVAALGTAVKALDLDTEVKPRGVTVSDSKVSVAVSSAASPAVHDLRVRSLATAQITQSKTFATNTAGVAGTGSVGITVGSTLKTVSYGPTDTLDAIATKINAAGAGVTASVLNDGSTFRLVLAANDTGTAAAASFTPTSGDSLELDDNDNIKIAAKNAVISIDGVDVTRPKNVISDALAGVTLTLNAEHAVADPATKATVSLDQKGLVDKLKAMVTAYNSVNSALHVQLDYTGTTRSTSSLFGDTTLRQLQGALASVMGAGYGGSSLGALGISRDRTGAMTLDEAKLSTALSADPDAVSKVFVNGGFATKVTALADSYTTSTTGIFATKTESINARFKALQGQIDRINSNADSLQERLEKQFSALEQAMSNLQSKSSFLSRIL